MALKISAVLFVFVLVVAAMAVAPVAEAQRGGRRRGQGQGQGLISIQGTLFCTADDSNRVNGCSTPVFPNATVQLLCRNDTIVSKSATNAQGRFSILLDPLQFLISALLSNCNLTVNTPLSSCNATLPPLGTLFSPLQFLSNTRIGFLNITNLVPSGFQLD